MAKLQNFQPREQTIPSPGRGSRAWIISIHRLNTIVLAVS